MFGSATLNERFLHVKKMKYFVMKNYKSNDLCKHNYWTIILHEWNAIDYACFFHCL